MTIVVVDDQPIIADALAASLQARGYTVIGIGYCAEDAVRICREHQPECVLLDMRLTAISTDSEPNESKGLATLQMITTEFPRIKVVMLSNIEAYQQQFASILVQCRGTGARAFVHKAQSTTALVDILEHLRIAPTYFTPEQYELMLRHEHNVPLEPLTQREHEVLQLVALGLMDKQIATHLQIAVGTVRKHLEKLYPKLGANNRTEAVRVAQRRGWLR